MYDLYFTYCESTSLWRLQQPINVFSNLVFIVIALWIWLDPSAKFHRFGLLAIALGSSIWHATELPWALWLDIGMIVVWAVLYGIDFSRCQKVATLKVIFFGAGFLIVTGLSSHYLRNHLIMQSGAFLPFLIISLILSLTLKKRKLKRVFALSAIFMTTAIIMREIDLPTCVWTGIGTHFLWHIFSGISLIAPIIYLKEFTKKNRFRT